MSACGAECLLACLQQQQDETKIPHGFYCNEVFFLFKQNIQIQVGTLHGSGCNFTEHLGQVSSTIGLGLRSRSGCMETKKVTHHMCVGKLHPRALQMAPQNFFFFSVNVVYLMVSHVSWAPVLKTGVEHSIIISTGSVKISPEKNVKLSSFRQSHRYSISS